jgi:ABC-2 type transport system ATP-binding protein
MSISVENLSKTYGSQIALNDVSFIADKGEVIGLLGPNGAGKSTLMKILTGYISADNGAAIINDFNIDSHRLNAQKGIGYLPEQNPLYKEMYVKEYLQFHASISRLSKNEVFDVIEKVGLTPEAHKRIHQLSKGYQQRVGLAAAIIHDPEVLILDEPTTGLDPNQLIEIRKLIKSLGANKTVLLSTHIMQEVEALCDRVLILKKGNLVLNEKLSDLKKRKNKSLEEIFHELTIS